MNILSSAGADNLIHAVLHDKQLASIENHAYVGVGEVKLLIATASPGDLRELAGLHIAQKHGAGGGCNQVPVLIHVYLGDFMTLL